MARISFQPLGILPVDQRGVTCDASLERLHGRRSSDVRSLLEQTVKVRARVVTADHLAIDGLGDYLTDAGAQCLFHTGQQCEILDFDLKLTTDIRVGVRVSNLKRAGRCWSCR